MATIEKLLNKLTGRTFNYLVTLKYTPTNNNGNNTYTTRTVEVNIKWRYANILREIRKTLGPSMINSLPPYMLDNGNLSITAIDYIGWY